MVELGNISWRSGQGSGETLSDDPDTLEQIHDAEGSEVTEKEMFERHNEVKGDSFMPVKLPATVMFVPLMSLKVIALIVGKA